MLSKNSIPPKVHSNVILKTSLVNDNQTTTQAAVLSDRKIKEEMANGNIIILPFHDKNLQSSSYDLTLGKFFYREQPPASDIIPIFNPYNLNEVVKVWGKECHEAVKAKVYMKKYPDPNLWQGILPNDEVIMIAPGETILGHSAEFIGFRNIGTTMMKARSSTGRVFIEVCKCAGWGDNGYINRWTMEITNNSRYYYIPLLVGGRIAQMIFFYTGETDRPYHTTGTYQQTDDFKKLVKIWKPETMLPRLRR